MTAEQRLVVALRALSPDWKRRITQGMLSKPERHLLEDYRALTVVGRRRLSRLIKEYAAVVRADRTR